MTLLCSSCHQPHFRVGQRYCPKCHADYQKRWRENRRKSVSREANETRLTLHDIALRYSNPASNRGQPLAVVNDARMPSSGRSSLDLSGTSASHGRSLSSLGGAI